MRFHRDWRFWVVATIAAFALDCGLKHARRTHCAQEPTPADCRPFLEVSPAPASEGARDG
jgi:hypothetical protein